MWCQMPNAIKAVTFIIRFQMRCGSIQHGIGAKPMGMSCGDCKGDLGWPSWGWQSNRMS